MRDLLQNKWDTVISVQQKNYIISAIKQRKIKKNRLKMLSHFRNDSCLTTYLTTLELSRKWKSQKPWKFKVSDSSVNRGWENRTPAKGFGDPYHTTWPIPYILFCCTSSLSTHYLYHINHTSVNKIFQFFYFFAKFLFFRIYRTSHWQLLSYKYIAKEDLPALFWYATLI